MDHGWRFHRGDIPFPVVSGHGESYQNAKAGRAGGAAAPDFDDTSWRVLRLPHDWVVEGGFDETANVAQGYRRRGLAWYRRHFKLDRSDRGRHLELEFDGIATHATVWVNGTLAHRNFCGYTGFTIDISSLAVYGEALNTIAVRVDAEQQEGWWYEGGGLYRHVWLTKRSGVHIVTDGVFAAPVKHSKEIWQVPVEVTLANTGRDSERVTVRFTLVDPAGETVARGTGQPMEIAALHEETATQTLEIMNPRLWSVDTPTLYRLETSLWREGVELDTETVPVGFRTIRFDATEGFFLNGDPLKIQGTCNHQDHAGVGVAVPDALWEYRLRRLKEMGANAYRCAHHPPAREFLDAADRLGMLVMDENRLFNPMPEYLRQVDWMVRRDRNHPSVFLWSVFNEEPNQDTYQGCEMARRLVARVKALDPTRPVTAALNGGLFAPENVSQVVDVVGFNYQQECYDAFHAQNPTRPLLSSEDASGQGQRGETVTDPSRNLIDDYDTQKPHWGATHREAWRAIAERPFMAGGFVWTGFDYRGEPTPYQWPSTGSFFGCMDQCGFAKTGYYIHQAHWRHDEYRLHVAPHWTWPGREGESIKLLVIGNVEKVSLRLNGNMLGTRKVDRFAMLEWEVPYVPGNLEATGWVDEKVVVRTKTQTVSAAVALRLIPNRPTLAGDERDAMPVTVMAVDDHGRLVPDAMHDVEFETEGNGRIIGLGNGDPNSHEPEQGSSCRLFHGLAQVVVQSGVGSGCLRLRAAVPGLEAAVANVVVEKVALGDRVPEEIPQLSLSRWRRSPVVATRPDPNVSLAENDQNSWDPVAPGNLQIESRDGWRIFRVSFRAHAAMERHGGRLRFDAVAGRATVWLDGERIAEKATNAPDRVLAPLPPGHGRRTINVLFRVEAGLPSGLDGPVLIESQCDDRGGE